MKHAFTDPFGIGIKHQKKHFLRAAYFPLPQGSLDCSRV
jgi:hypothetical protein